VKCLMFDPFVGVPSHDFIVSQFRDENLNYRKNRHVAVNPLTKSKLALLLVLLLKYQSNP